MPVQRPIGAGTTRVALALILGVTGTAAAANSRYCASPVGVHLHGRVDSEDRPAGPTRFEPISGASTALAFDEVRKDLPDGKSYNLTKRYWRYRADRRFEGPYTFERAMEPVGTDGRLIYLRGGRYRTNTPLAKKARDGKHWEARLFVVQPGELPEMVGGDLALPQWTYFIERYRPDLEGVVVRASFEPPSGPYIQPYLLAAGKRVNLISNDAARPHTLFPRWNLSVSADRNRMRLLGPNRRGRELELPHTDDFQQWESLNIDRYGWLFAEGWGNDYAIKWRHHDGGIAVERVVKYTGSGWLGRLARWLLGGEKGTPVASTHYSAQCADFSPVLQLTIFCKPAKVLREGELEDMGDGDAPLKRYIGDATGSRTALFHGKDQRLYAFDGEAVQKIEGISARLVAVRDFPGVARTFVTGGKVAAELVGRFPNLRLRPLDLPRAQGRFDYPPAGTTFHLIPGDREPLAFTAAGVWSIRRDGAFTPIWEATASPIQVSQVSPAGIWNGLIFRTQAGQNMLVRRCDTGGAQ
ncbi:MAG: hypothetical protein M3Q19_04430 [Pseudomonadota bacterium]|nr:hypothetical protein [Pseudomonadota bacterium]